MNWNGFGSLLAVTAGSAGLAVGCQTGDAAPGGGAGGGGSTPATCSATSADSLAACVDQSRYQQDLATIAAPRPPGSAHWQAVQDLCAARFAELGYEVELQAYGTGVNVIGTRTGSTADARVIVSAHYDHVDGCTGADDNASGVAGVLEVARVLAGANLPGTLVVACWDEEERGLVGSEAYAARAATLGEVLTVAFVFEMIGYLSTEPGSQELPSGIDLLFPDAAAAVAANDARGDFIAVVADDRAAVAASSFEAAATRQGLPAITLALPAGMENSSLLSDLQRSDHASFWQQGLPAVMITDTAEFRNPHYHCTGGEDAVVDLDGAFAAGVVRATVSSVARALGLD